MVVVTTAVTTLRLGVTGVTALRGPSLSPPPWPGKEPGARLRIPQVRIMHGQPYINIATNINPIEEEPS